MRGFITCMEIKQVFTTSNVNTRYEIAVEKTHPGVVITTSHN